MSVPLNEFSNSASRPNGKRIHNGAKCAGVANSRDRNRDIQLVVIYSEMVEARSNRAIGGGGRSP